MFRLMATFLLGGVGVVVALVLAYANFQRGKRYSDQSTPTMKEIAAAIREGANAFLKREFKVSGPVIAVLAVVFGLVFHPICGVAFVVGAACSLLAGLIGMKAAVIYNERVTNSAKYWVEHGGESEAEQQAGKMALRGGSVMGYATKGLALLGLLAVWLVVGELLKGAAVENLVYTNSFLPFLPIKFIMFVQCLTCYSLGCSTIAVFNRLGGGIYTKGADMGADLVGKTEMDLPEDDPRNPAVIADCVGDNVGDVAGNGSDLLESTVASIVAAVVLAVMMFTTSVGTATPMSTELLGSLMQYPVAFAGVGLLACLLGVSLVLQLKVKSVKNALNWSLWGSAVLIAGGTLALSYLFFGNAALDSVSFRLGWISPWLGALVGIGAGILMGVFAEYYTSERYKPTAHLARSSKEGPAIVITEGLGLGWKSCMAYGITFGVSLVVANIVAGAYGIAMAAVGMLSFVAATVSVDTYGPIADNAGGISEMSGLPAVVRKITDSLDSLGNTTAAIGKGFAIGSGALAALSTMSSFLESSTGGSNILNVLNPIVLAGAFCGAALLYWLSGVMMAAVSHNAAAMVQEVRRQWPGIQAGDKPDSATCIDICTAHALRSMRKPVLVALMAPIICGMIGGVDLVGGLLLGSILVATVMAIATANSGGAWDNGKKTVKARQSELSEEFGEQVWEEMHKASVVGDTVGDPCKDVIGPNMDILIKLMCMMALVCMPLIGVFSLL